MRSLCRTVTSVMYQAGTRLPASSLRRPVSISCCIRILTSVTPSFAVARIFIGLAMLLLSLSLKQCRSKHHLAATAYRDPDLSGSPIEFPVGLHQRNDRVGLPHFYACGDESFRSFRQDKVGRKRIRVFFHQDGNLFGAGEITGNRDWNERAVFGDLGRG